MPFRMRRALCLGVAVLVVLYRMAAVVPPSSLPAYVAWTRQRALAHLHDDAPATHMTLVMGNAAGDLDSVAGALSLSYLFGRYPAFAEKHGLPADALYAPVLQTTRASLRQRRENRMVLDALRIAEADLLCLDELGVDLATSPSLTPQANVSFALVDHGALTPTWGTGVPRHVDVIVDHHEDDGSHTDARLRIIRPPSTDPVGSASSIVALLFQAALTDAAPPLDRTVADLLLSAIMLDTKNLRMAPEGKATETDAAAYAYLLAYSSFADAAHHGAFIAAAASYGVVLPSSPVEAEVDEVGVATVPSGTPREVQKATAAWAKALQRVKSDVSHLSTQELLLRDLKIAEVPTRHGMLRVGIASVPLSLSAWLSESYRVNAPAPDTTEDAAEAQWEAWWAAVHAWMHSLALDVAVVLTSFKDVYATASKSRRDLVLAYAPHSPAASFDAVVRELRAYNTPSLGLEAYQGQRKVDGQWEGVHALGADSRVRSDPTRFHAAVFRQGRVSANRKVVQPAIVRILTQLF